MSREDRPTIVKCDRCGHTQEGADMIGTLEAPTVHLFQDQHRFDLCWNCWHEAASWVKRGKPAADPSDSPR